MKNEGTLTSRGLVSLGLMPWEQQVSIEDFATTFVPRYGRRSFTLDQVVQATGLLFPSLEALLVAVPEPAEKYLLAFADDSFFLPVPQVDLNELLTLLQYRGILRTDDVVVTRHPYHWFGDGGYLLLLHPPTGQVPRTSWWDQTWRQPTYGHQYALLLEVILTLALVIRFDRALLPDQLLWWTRSQDDQGNPIWVGLRQNSILVSSREPEELDSLAYPTSTQLIRPKP